MEGQQREGRIGAALRELRRFLAEAVLLVGLMLIYWLMRGAVPERAAAAFSRANHIINIEQRLGIFVELRWQAHILGNRTLVDIANWIYLYGHLPLLILAAIWIYLHNRGRYRIYRNALLISACIGLVIYQLFPVAPPRLMPEWGFVDTIALFNNNSNEIQPGFIVNHYAAVPSLHFGWALLVGIALLDISRSFWVKAFAVLFPALMFFSVVLTGNHFIFDGIVGALVVLLAIVLAFGLENARPGIRHTLLQIRVP